MLVVRVFYQQILEGDMWGLKTFNCNFPDMFVDSRKAIQGGSGPFNLFIPSQEEVCFAVIQQDHSADADEHKFTL